MSIKEIGRADVISTKMDINTRNYYCEVRCACGYVYKRRRASWIAAGVSVCPECKGHTNWDDLKVFSVNKRQVSK